MVITRKQQKKTPETTLFKKNMLLNINLLIPSQESLKKTIHPSSSRHQKNSTWKFQPKKLRQGSIQLL